MKTFNKLSHHIIVLVGNIGSGKSTTVREIRSKNPSYICISRESLRYMIGGGVYIYNPSYEPILAENTLNLASRCMQEGVNLIYDETSLNKEMRKPILNLAKVNAYDTTALVLPKYPQHISVDNRLKNNHGQTPKETWNKVWDKFNDIYEKPTKGEGFDEVVFRSAEVNFKIDKNGKGETNVTFTD